VVERLLSKMEILNSNPSIAYALKWEGWGQWQSTCLACMSSWVPSLAPGWGGKP
jgi:hypothetical protein